MKRFVALIILSFLLISSAPNLFAQSHHYRHSGVWHYEWGIGFRWAGPISISLKKNFHSTGHGVEFALGTPTKSFALNTSGFRANPPRGASMFISYHIQHDIGTYGGLIIYYGPAAVFSIWKKGTARGGDALPYFDVGAGLGAEYAFDRPQISCFIDFVPVIELTQDAGRFLNYGGFGIRLNIR